MNRCAALVGASLLATFAAGCSGEVEDGVMGQYVGGQDSFAVTAPVCPGPTTVQGIDVSFWQGTIDWAEVRRSGRYWAYARLGYGTGSDSYFATNWPQMKAAGILRGAYLYYRPSQDPRAQAQLVVSKVGKLGAGDLPVMADVETTEDVTPSAIAAGLAIFMDAVEAGTGKRPVLYTGSYFWDDFVKSTAFSSYALVIPAYGVTCPRLPNAWSAFIAHQYSDTGKVAGIAGNVDLDLFNGSLAQLQALAASPTGTLRGVIYVSPDTSAVLAGATVKLSDGRTTTTGTSGVYSFDVPPGSYTVTASKAGYTSASVTRDVTAGAVTWGSIGLLATPTTGTLRGVVHRYNPAAPSDTSAVLADAEVSLDGGPWQRAGSGFSFTVAPGSHTVSARLAGYVNNATTRTVIAGQTVVGNVGLSLVPPPPTVHVDSPLDGAVLLGSHVVIRGSLQNAGGVSQVRVRFAGMEAVGTVAAGSFEVPIDVPVGETAIEVIAANTAGTGRATLRVRYQTGLCGLTLQDGFAGPGPLGAASVELLAAEGCGAPLTTTVSDDDGRFCFDLPPGDYQVRARASGFGSAVVPATVELPARGHVELTLAAGVDPIPSLTLLAPAPGADGKILVTEAAFSLQGVVSGMEPREVRLDGVALELRGAAFVAENLTVAPGETVFLLEATGPCGETARLRVTVVRSLPEAGQPPPGGSPGEPYYPGIGCSSAGGGAGLFGLAGLAGLLRRRSRRARAP